VRHVQYLDCTRTACRLGSLFRTVRPAVRGWAFGLIWCWVWLLGAPLAGLCAGLSWPGSLTGSRFSSSSLLSTGCSSSSQTQAYILTPDRDIYHFHMTGIHAIIPLGLFPILDRVFLLFLSMSIIPLPFSCGWATEVLQLLNEFYSSIVMGERNEYSYMSGYYFCRYIVSFWQYRNIIFELVGCTCTKTIFPSLLVLLLLNKETICFQNFYFHDWSKLSCPSAADMLSNTFRTSHRNKITVWNGNAYRMVRIGNLVSSYRIVRSLAIPSPRVELVLVLPLSWLDSWTLSIE
jgi:hypothetical protein